MTLGELNLLRCPAPKQMRMTWGLRGHAAIAQIQMGEVSRARHILMGAPSAPRTEKDVRSLCRAGSPGTSPTDGPGGVAFHTRRTGAVEEKSLFRHVVCEKLQQEARQDVDNVQTKSCVCLDDSELLSLLHFAAHELPHGEIPLEVTRFVTLASMTAVRKPDGEVRGIANDIVFRRLVSKCLSRQCISEVEKVFTISIHHVDPCSRAITDLNDRTTVLSIDGVEEAVRSGKHPLSVAVRQGCLFQTFHVPLAGRRWSASCDPTVRGKRTDLHVGPHVRSMRIVMLWPSADKDCQQVVDTFKGRLTEF